MTLTEDEFYQKEYDLRKKQLQEQFKDWSVEDHLKALIVPQKAYDKTFRRWTPPELEHRLEQEISEHCDALRMLHEFKEPIGESVNTFYDKLSPKMQQKLDKEINSVHDRHPGRYWKNYEEIEPDMDDK